MTLDEFIERLQSLRKVTGGEVEVTVPLDDNGNPPFLFTHAIPEVQNVISHGDVWESLDDKNTEQVISVV